MATNDKTVTYRCEQGHSIRLRLDGALAEEVRARRARNGTCEVGVKDGICGARLLDTQSA